MDWLLEPWPWYVSGPLIGFMVPALLLIGNKSFGVSTSFQHLSAMWAPHSELPYLKNYDWRKNNWRLVFVIGIVIGGFIGSNLLSAGPVQLLPAAYYSWHGVIALAIGGLLVGFGARYASGCTSGHCITGLSNLEWASFVATLSFLAGGMLMIHLIRPLLPFF